MEGAQASAHRPSTACSRQRMGKYASLLCIIIMHHYALLCIIMHYNCPQTQTQHSTAEKKRSKMCCCCNHFVLRMMKQLIAETSLGTLSGDSTTQQDFYCCIACGCTCVRVCARQGGTFELDRAMLEADLLEYIPLPPPLLLLLLLRALLHTCVCYEHLDCQSSSCRFQTEEICNICVVCVCPGTGGPSISTPKPSEVASPTPATAAAASMTTLLPPSG